MRRRYTALMVSAVVVSAAGTAEPTTADQDPSAPQAGCTAQAASLQGIAVTSVKGITAGKRDGQEVPTHCQIDGKFEQRIGAGGKSYAIAFQLRVPERWNGRLLFQGGGGLNGSVGPALGGVIGAAPNAGLLRGYAVVSTDSGHQGSDASFAADQLAKLNYGYASIGKVVIVAKRLLAQMRGSGPERTYFAGCSNGGREAMQAAQRFPEEFDGVIAGSPAFNLSDATLLARFSTSVYRDAAPKAPDGTPQIPLALLPAESKLLANGILKQCDALDGMRDGFVFNQGACRFDPRVLQCKPGQASGDCLSASKIQMIRKAFAGPIGRDGQPLVSHWTYDTGVDTDLWRIWQMGVMMNGKPVTLLPRLVDETLARFYNYPMLDPTKLGQVNTAAMRPRLADSAAIANATSTQMSTFASKGSKMLIVSGWSEPIFAPMDLVSWYSRLDRDMTAGANTTASSFSRLFMVPGMTHCGGGPSLDQFDALTALTNWVEKGEAPDRLIASGKAYLGVSRPICPYPQFAFYRRGPKDEASSYNCEAPRT